MNADDLGGELPPCPTCGHDDLRPNLTVYEDGGEVNPSGKKTAAETAKDVSASCGYCGAGIGLGVRVRIEAQQVSEPSEGYQEGHA